MLLNKMAAAAFRALSTLTTCGRRSLTTTSSPMLFPLTLPLPPFNPSGNGPYDATELSSIYRSNYAWLKGKVIKVVCLQVALPEEIVRINCSGRTVALQARSCRGTWTRRASLPTTRSTWARSGSTGSTTTTPWPPTSRRWSR